jgi:hypothetical protein
MDINVKLVWWELQLDGTRGELDKVEKIYAISRSIRIITPYSSIRKLVENACPVQSANNMSSRLSVSLDSASNTII